MLSIQLLIILMIIIAIIAVELKEMISSVICIGALGLFLCLTFLILKAPDLAAVLLIVEVVTLTFLVKATLETSHVERRRSDILIVPVMLMFLAFFVMLAYKALAYIPLFGYPLMTSSSVFIQEAYNKLNALSVLTAISIGFRGYDSLGALLILFAVTVGIKTITDKVRREK